MAKDRFSTQAALYARYRPAYPQELYDHIFQFVAARTCAWDCATGNGQAAAALAKHFAQVEATDISEGQLKNAVRLPNVRYSVCPAEQTPFSGDSFDLITAATAYHWFDTAAFFREATRVGKQDCVVAVWAYRLVQCADENVNVLIRHFYYDIVYNYWDPERRHVDAGYETIPFEFAPLPAKEFIHTVRWQRDDLPGLFSTWSAVQNYVKKEGASPLPLIEEKLEQIWPQADEDKEFHFRVFLRIGRIKK